MDGDAIGQSVCLPQDTLSSYVGELPSLRVEVNALEVKEALRDRFSSWV